VERFLKNTPTLNSTKIPSVGVGVFHTDRQTDMSKLIIVFRNFVNEPINQEDGIKYRVQLGLLFSE